MAPVLSKRYTKIVENRRGMQLPPSAAGVSQGKRDAMTGAMGPMDKGVGTTFDNDIDAQNSKPQAGETSTISSKLAVKTGILLDKSGRKEDSIRSWIKNPGPLQRDSFSKFQETDNSIDNSGVKGTTTANLSPDLPVNKVYSSGGTSTIQEEIALTSGRMRTNKPNIPGNILPHTSGVNSRASVNGVGGQKVIQPIKVPLSRRISNVTSDTPKPFGIT